MENLGHFYIILDGKVGDEPLTPRTYDVREVIETLQHAQDLLFGSDKKDRPQLTYALEEGSVRHILTTVLAVVVGVTQQLELVRESGTLANLDATQAGALLWFQEMAARRGYTCRLGTSERVEVLVIDGRSRLSPVVRQFVETELYFYGQIVDAGGKSRPNLHLLTAEYGLLTLAIPRELLAGYHGNPLYRTHAVRAIGKQDSMTGEINFDSVRVQSIELHEYTHYDEEYISLLREKAARNWLGELPDPDGWLSNLRGNGE